MTEISGAEDWRVLNGCLSTWFDTPSLSAGAALVEQLAELPNALPDVDLRAKGMRLRIRPEQDGRESARRMSDTARELGLGADPSALQEIRWVIEAADTTAVTGFWQTALGYEGTLGTLRDPLRRDPALSIHRLADARPLRNRIHVDVVRGPEAVDAVKAATGRVAYGAFGLTLADNEGNEADLVPGDELSPDAADWRTNFGAMVFYPTTSPMRSNQLATVVANLADDAGIPLLIDLRPEGVMIDSGKDQWEEDVPTGGAAFAELAKHIQGAAHDLGLSADARPLRFVQFGVDAVDAAAVSAFWTTLLGYRPDARAHVSDVYDPRRLNPVLFFQQMDASDEQRRRQRNRIRFDLAVPEDGLRARVDAAVSAGGRVVSEEAGRCLVADPEGNEVQLTAAGT